MWSSPPSLSLQSPSSLPSRAAPSPWWSSPWMATAVSSAALGLVVASATSYFLFRLLRRRNSQQPPSLHQHLHSSGHTPLVDGPLNDVANSDDASTVADSFAFSREWNLSGKRIGVLGIATIARSLSSPLTAMTRLNLKCNNLDDTAASALAAGLRANVSLTHLLLGFNRISPAGARTIAFAVDSHAALRTLDLSGNPIGDAGASAIARTVLRPSSLCRLRTLKLYWCGIDDRGIATVGDALAANKSLVVLVLSRSRVARRGAAALARSLRVNNTLRALDLSACGVGDAEIIAIASGLYGSAGGGSSLRVLDLQENRVTDVGVLALAKALDTEACAKLRREDTNRSPTWKSILLEFAVWAGGESASPPSPPEGGSSVGQAAPLRVLNLNRNRISHPGATALATALAKNRTLTTLRLYSNPIGPIGATAIASALGMNRTLIHLDLDYTNAETAGGISILTALSSPSCPLETLGLCSNYISADAAPALVSLFATNAHLRQLRLSGNHLTDATIQSLSQALPGHPALCRLDLSVVGMQDDGASALARALPHTRITHLTLNSNAIGDAGAAALAAALPRLHDLRLSRNAVAGPGAAALAAALPAAETCHTLYLGLNPSIPDDAVDALRAAAARSHALRAALFSARHDGRDLPAWVSARNAGIAGRRAVAAREILAAGRALCCGDAAGGAGGGKRVGGGATLPRELVAMVLERLWPDGDEGGGARMRAEVRGLVRTAMERASLGSIAGDEGEEEEEFSVWVVLERCRRYLDLKTAAAAAAAAELREVV